jgi:hypothetical protein
MRHYRLGIEAELFTADGSHEQDALFRGEDNIVRHFTSAELEGMIGRGVESGESGFVEYESRGGV